MNRNRYRLVFNTTLGMMVPVAETARRQGKAASGSALVLASVLLAGPSWAELPVASVNFAAPGTTASYQASGTQAYVSQVGSKAIVNFQTGNISAGHDLQFRQVDSLLTNNLVPGANFSVLARIHDINPSVIAGSISQAVGQKANVTMVNTNGIAFMGGSEVNLNSFTASSLNIQDSFLDNFLPGTDAAQFENTEADGAARGFVKVFEGAKITAGSQGRVMLIAPTVVNKGTVTAPDGQVIAAAGAKVYLRSVGIEDTNVRGLLVEVDSPAGLADFDTANPDVKDGELDGQAVSFANAAEDKLGHVTNLGELTTPRGNVTMVGYAVNQLGIARATTSVVSNGSVYLLAKDTKATSVIPIPGSLTDISSARAGRVLLGQNSLTEIKPEVADSTTGLDGTTGAGLAKASLVKVLGEDIRMASGAEIDAPAAQVEFLAIEHPNDPLVLMQAGKTASDRARIHIAGGARIDVAGLENVAVSAARNGVEVELRGDELKDSPVNQQGPLRGEKVYVDINRALANADAGKSTLIASDSLEAYQAKLERGVAERSTAGGTVRLLSEGETILENGAVFDLSGGSVSYTAANLKTTLLTSNGKLTDLADASAETRYDGIATRYVVDYGRWNRKEVIDLGQSFRYDPGYVEGKDAGSLDVIGMKAVVMQADIQGRTTTGELQREAGTSPEGARLRLGSDAVVDIGGGGLRDYKLNQRVELSSNGVALPEDFKFGDALAQDLKDTLALNPSLMGKDKVAQLEVFSNQAAEVREALRMPTGGSVSITAEGVAVKADIQAASGEILLAATQNALNGVPKSLDVTVADGVTLSARGGWANDLPGATGKSADAAKIDGGLIALTAVGGDVVLGESTLVDVSGGARVKPDGKLKNGNGGNVTLESNRALKLGGEVRGYALGKGGTYKLKAQKIQIGGAPVADALNLDAAFFERGGFADFSLTGSDGVDIADGTVLRPTAINRELLAAYALQPTGSDIGAFSRLVKQDDFVRQAANVSFSTTGIGTKIRLGENAKILADDQAKISFRAPSRVELLGEVRAAGGSISANVSSSQFDSSEAVWLGSNGVLDVAGVARTYLDSRGLTQGEVLGGGKVTLGGTGVYVVTEEGSRIDVSGAAPVRLDVHNEAGDLGRDVGSDAGSVTIATTEGALLDGAIAAHAGSAANRGGAFNLKLDDTRDRTLISGAPPVNGRVLNLASTLAPQVAGLEPGDAIPLALNGNTRVSTQAIEAAGFDRVAYTSETGMIRLENGLNVGAGRAMPLRELSLNAPRIETVGGDATLTADAVRLGNYGEFTDTAPAAQTTSGTFTVNARQIELAGKLALEGMAQAVLNGEEATRLVGGFPESRVEGQHKIDLRPVGELKTGANLVFHGAVVAPASYVQYSIHAPGKTVRFTQGGTAPNQPLSAFGSLTVEAKDIAQGGSIWAPLGKINLLATDTLTFENGSLTSAAADASSLLPFGKILNGRTWTFDLNADETDSIEFADTPEQKSILAQAAKVNMQPGARVDLGGGGDAQAYEFSVGPGGSRDILADRNTYAILPGYTGGFAPSDAQESFDRASGEAVFLSGVPGLDDGVYTLLPAHYALLPGAYAVKLDTGIKDVMPGQAYSRQDGVRIAAGYVTDTRAGAPKDANWQGVQVLTHDQVRARSEFTLTRASEFFADSRIRLQDAGLLSVNTSGTGAGALKLDAIYDLAAPDGRGAQVDISALKLAVTSGTVAGLDSDTVVLDAADLNALGAESLFIGGTRSASGDTTTLTVGADAVTLANDAAHALKAGEVMLAARDRLTLKSGSAIDAQGEPGDAGHYQTEGNGAFVRAASTTATFARTGSPDGSLGTLIGEAAVKDDNGSVITTTSSIAAADSIALDATKKNAFKGTTKFEKEKTENGEVIRTAVAGNLAVGATRINFGEAPSSAEGIIYSQAELNAFNSLNGLTLTSYTTFDLYTGKTETVNGVTTASGVKVGGMDSNNNPTLQNLTLQGAGLAGIDNAGQTAQLNAKNLTLVNPNNAATFTTGGTLGSGNLAVTADTLTLGAGDKDIKGFNSVSVTANELVAAAGTGTLDIDAPVTLNVARISGARGADQALRASADKLTVAQHTADRILAPVTALGAKWAMQGSSVDFDSHVELPSGSFKLAASSGDVTLGANARVDVAGREVQFFDVKKPSWGGTAEFVSETGNVKFETGSNVDVSAAAGGDAGTLIVRAAQGTIAVAEGSVEGKSLKDADGRRGEGARVEIDTGTLASFSALNTALNGPGRLDEGVAVYDGFDGARALRVSTGDVSIDGTDSVRAHDIRIAADGGKLDVQGTLDVSGEDAGRIELFAKGDVNVLADAELLARSTGAGEDGGDIEIGSAEGTLNFASSTMKVQGSGGAGGTVLLRALRTGPVDAETEVAVKAFDSTGKEITTNALGSVGISGTLTGARSISVEAVKVYQDITMLTATDNSLGNLGLDKVTEDNAKFAGNVPSNPGANYVAIKTRLGKTDDPALHILSGVEIRSTGDLTLAQDWNLKDSRAGGEAGALTLRAAGNLNVNANLSDGFGQVTPMKSGSNPADLLTGNSWGYRLVAGADVGAADPMAVKPAAGSMSLAANKLIRTGTGDIRVASGGDIALGNDKSVIYTAGRRADAIAGFTDPKWSNATLISNFAQFSQGGGDVFLAALGNIVGVPSAQLINNWLFRQGRLDTAGTAYAAQPAWWVRFDQFRQGVGALGGGDVTIKAGGNVENLPAHTPTQARMASATPDASALVQIGGGTVRVETGGDLLGGQYFSDRGDVVLKAGGKVDSGGRVNGSGQPIYTILALGDGAARVSAQGDVNINAVFNPTLFDQSSSTGSSTAKSVYNVTNKSDRDSAFSTYTDASAASLQSLGGAARLHSVDSLVVDPTLFVKPLNDNQSPTIYGLDILPPSLSMVAFQGDATISEPGSSGSLVMISAPHSTLEVLARGTVALNQTLVMSDRAPTTFPGVVLPVNPQASTNPIAGWGEKENNPLFHAPEPVHAIDLTPVRIYAVGGDIVGGSAASDNATRLDVPKAFVIQAGRDVKNISIEAQHVNSNNAESRVQAGRDVTFSTGIQRTESDHIHVGGSGSLDVIAGRDIDLGSSGGIVSRGNSVNPVLSGQGADIRIAAGVGTDGVDYSSAVVRLLTALEAGAPDDNTLWQARWLVGDNSLTASDAVEAVKQIAALDVEKQSDHVRNMLYTAQRTTGRDSLDAGSLYAADYARGYAAIELVFPGISDRNPDGSFANYQGGINLFASRVKTESGGNIEWIVPGGDMVVGLANTPKALVDTGTNVLGVVAAGEGDIKGFSRGDVLVNQSRILTVGGGDVLLWSSEGDIDAGKGKKTAVAVPPPLILVDSKGNVTQVLQGAASGSGIGALTPAGGTAGDVDLIAPKGTVNAGDAGIRAGNLNIAAQVVLGADNISVSGSSAGTPVADTSAVTAASSGATNAGDVSSTTAALSQNLADAARAAEELKQAFKPTFISAEVIGHGE